MKNAEWMIQQDMEFSKLSWAYVTGKNTVKNTVYYDKGGYLKKIYSEKSTCPENLITKWLDMEHEPFLDEAEKKYLSAVIKPFRGRVEYIVKSSSRCKHGFCRIRVCFHDSNDDIYLPFFNEMAMYKGVKMDKAYTLEELGL